VAARRILHLTDRLTDRGGAHWHLLGILERQAREHEVLVAAGAAEGVAAPCPSRIVPGLESRTRRAVDLAPLADAFAPDVVHVHTVVNPAVLEWAAARGAVITVQDHRYFCPTRGKWTADGRVCDEVLREDLCRGCFEDERYFQDVYALTTERLATLRGLRVVVLSHYMKMELIGAGLRAEAVTVVPPLVHGLDPEAQPDGPPCVLFVGRLAEAKGVWDAVAAWRRAAVPLPLVFAGTGPLREALEREDGVHVLGWVPHGRLSAVYRRARALLVPSRWQEPFGIAGVEALTMGVPVVAWDSGGVREWLGDPGVAWGDVDGLARALREAVHRRAAPPAGYEPAELMRRLDAVYGGPTGAAGAAAS
jgi:glycosyltransferase involved in cell wall biosynthesis